MPRWGMVIDLDKCTGCQACVVACKQENNVPFSEEQEGSENRREIQWLTVMAVAKGEYPNVGLTFMPMMCQMCDTPPCVRICPVGATYLDREGLVGQVYPRCIGCRYCANACPYQVKYFNWFWPEWPKEMEASLNSDVSVRPKGVIEKCTFCVQRLQKARERAALEGREVRSEGEYVPACVESCPAQAMYFGDLDDPKTQVRRLAQDARAFRIMEHLGTRPKVYYLRKGGSSGDESGAGQG